MPYEPTSRGNPQQLTINQHFHTAHAISIFYDSNNQVVEVMDIPTNQVLKRNKRAKMFCTKRTWDQQAENGYMVIIESSFHEEIDNIKNFSERNHQAITNYCLLWRLRHDYHLKNLDNVALNGLSGSNLTKEQEEILENKNVSYFRNGGILPSRFVSGSLIQIRLMQEKKTWAHLKWGLLEALNGEFLVADSYDEWAFIPISPKLAFCAGVRDQTISKQELIEINKESIACAKNFYFARKISECPVS